MFTRSEGWKAQMIIQSHKFMGYKLSDLECEPGHANIINARSAHTVTSFMSSRLGVGMGIEPSLYIPRTRAYYSPMHLPTSLKLCCWMLCTSGKRRGKSALRIGLFLIGLWSSGVHDFWFLNWMYRCFQLCSLVECEVVDTIWRHGPVPFKHVSLWCLFSDAHLTTHQSDVGVWLRWVYQ